MSSIQQSKSILAKLLATENMTVEHRNVPTASFDVNNRILILPAWENISNDVYDLLVGHEVGHALFTPNLVGSDINLPQGYLNVIEDARIEKLMKRKYPGLARSFYKGYSELNDQDFFDLKSIDVNELVLIDRINLHFKLGSLSSVGMIKFSPEEQIIVDKVSAAETFDDVVEIVKELVDEMQQMSEMQLQVGDSECADGQNEGEFDGENSGDSNGNTSGQQSNSSGTSNGAGGSDPSGSNSSNGSANSNQNSPANSAGKSEDLTSHTDKAWMKNQEQITSSSTNNYIYISPPTINLDAHLVDWKTFSKDLPKLFTDTLDANTHAKSAIQSAYKHADSSYEVYKKDSAKSVSYLIKEFEMKKRATEYNRSSISTTGVLDTNKMHSYKWSDDVFKRVTVVPKGKSHGLIMHIDWSGSMQGNLVGTLKQLYNIIQFCKRCQIPFEVYSFNDRNVAKNFNRMKKSAKAKYSNEIHVNKDFSLVNFFSSRMTASQLETQMKNVWKLATILDRSVYLSYSWGHYDLGGTPLNECIFASIEVFNQFKNTYKVDKINTVFLTDGESNSVTYSNPVNRKSNYNGLTSAGWLRVNDVLCLQDKQRKITMMNISKDGSMGVTGAFVEYYRMVTDSNAVGFRLIDYYGAKSFVSRYLKDEYNSWSDVSSEWASSKSFVSKSLGYNELYLVGTLDDSTSSTVTSVKKNSTVTTEFKNLMSKKAFNKIILSKFVEQIA